MAPITILNCVKLRAVYNLLAQNHMMNRIFFRSKGSERRIVVVGSVNPGAAKNFSLLRFNPDGTLDTVIEIGRASCRERV